MVVTRAWTDKCPTAVVDDVALPTEAASLRSGASDEGPVDEHERNALRGAVVAHHLPRHRLLVRRLPPHARPAHAGGEVRQALLAKGGEAGQLRYGFGPAMHASTRPALGRSRVVPAA